MPNPSFEEVNYDFCGLFPTARKFEESIKNWLVPTASRPEIVSKSVDPSCWNFIGSEGLPRSGERVAVILLYGQKNHRSYLEVKLSESLKKGRQYEVEIFVKLNKYSRLACNNLGFHFSDTLVRVKHFDVLDLKPQVNFFEIISDTAGWVQLKGDFIADTEAEYLLIGNFFGNENTRVEQVRDTEFDAVFYMIDDVRVREVSEVREQEN